MLYMNNSKSGEKSSHKRNNIFNLAALCIAPILLLYQVNGDYLPWKQTPEAQNRVVSQKFDIDYESGHMAELTAFMNKVLPPLSKAGPDKLSSINVNETGHIQVNHPDFGHVFSNMDELSDMEYKNFIAGGIRGNDPAPQPNWEKTGLGRQWPPSQYQTVQLGADNVSETVLFQNENHDYQVKTRGIASVDADSGSVIWAFQQENNNPDIEWAAWTIAPFRVPEGKEVIGVFPVSGIFKDKYSKALGGKNQWDIDKNRSIVMVKPNKSGGFFDPFDSETNWCAFGIEGADRVIVMRSIYKMPFEDKFKACIVEDNARYVEKEFMAPKVSNGKKSTIACRLEFVSLSELGIKEFEKFEKGKMDEQMDEVSDKLLQLLG